RAHEGAERARDRGLGARLAAQLGDRELGRREREPEVVRDRSRREADRLEAFAARDLGVHGEAIERDRDEVGEREELLRVRAAEAALAAREVEAARAARARAERQAEHGADGVRLDALEGAEARVGGRAPRG